MYFLDCEKSHDRLEQQGASGSRGDDAEKVVGNEGVKRVYMYLCELERELSSNEGVVCLQGSGKNLTIGGYRHFVERYLLMTSGGYRIGGTKTFRDCGDGKLIPDWVIYGQSESSDCVSEKDGNDDVCIGTIERVELKSESGSGRLTPESACFLNECADSFGDKSNNQQIVDMFTHNIKPDGYLHINPNQNIENVFRINNKLLSNIQSNYNTSIDAPIMIDCDSSDTEAYGSDNSSSSEPCSSTKRKKISKKKIKNK